MQKQKRRLGYPKRLFDKFFGVADGARTHDNRNHNPGLYQLSYSHLWCFFAVLQKKLNNEEAEL